MSEEYTAERLLAAVARADNDAFKKLFEQTAPKMFAITSRICRDPAQAEKALQETFTAVWRRAPSFDARQNSGMTWLSRIARNRALAVIGRQPKTKSRTEGVYQPEEAYQPSEFLLPDLATARVDFPELDKLMTGLDKLDDKARQAVLLAYYEGRPRDGLAQRTDTPAKTLTKNLRRGLDKLRVVLERAG